MPVININNLTFGYDGSEKTLFDDVTITLDTSWKLALAGRNGRGKTTFHDSILIALYGKQALK